MKTDAESHQRMTERRRAGTKQAAAVNERAC